MVSLELLETLEEMVENASGVMFTGRCMLDRDELLELLQELRLKLPDDLKQAKWVKEERQRIIDEAQREANNILKGAEDKIISMINEHEITKKSYEQAREIEIASKHRAKEIRRGTMEFVENLLSDAEAAMEKTLAELCENRQIMRERNQKRMKEEENS